MVIGCLLLAPVSIAVFVAVERRVESPLLPLAFFGRRDFSASIVVSFFTSASYMGGYFLATLMMVRLFGYAEGAAAGILVIRPLVFSASSPLGGQLAGKVGNRITAVSGDIVLAMGLSSLALGAALESVAVVVVGFVLQGLGHGLVRPPTSTALANSVDEANLGIAAAAERLLGQLGTAFGITLLTVVYAGTNDPSRFAAAFASGAVLAAAGVVAATFMRPGRQQARARVVGD